MCDIEVSLAKHGLAESSVQGLLVCRAGGGQGEGLIWGSGSSLKLVCLLVEFTSLQLASSRPAGSSVISVSSVQSLSHVWLCEPMDYNTPGFPVHHQLPKLAQTQVHKVGDAIQPSHPLSSPSPPAFNLSHHEGLFQWVGSLHQVA